MNRPEKLNKEHICELCSKQSLKGSIYIKIKGMIDGEFVNYALHQHCRNLIDSYVEEFGPHDVAFDDVRTIS